MVSASRSAGIACRDDTIALWHRALLNQRVVFPIHSVLDQIGTDRRKPSSPI
jgi:hypothetical protein